MDVFLPSHINETQDYSYEDYYNLAASVDYGPCQKHQAKEFSQAFLPVFYSVTCVLGFVTNFFLIAVFIKCKSLRKALPLNMVSADLVFTATLPFWAVYAGDEWVFGHHACKLVTFLYIVGLYGSNLFVGFMILQKYVDMACGSVTRARRKIGLSVVLWLLSALAAAPHLYFVEAHEFQGQQICTNHFLHKHGWKIYMRYQMIVLGFCVPLAVLVFSSVVVLRIVARRTLLLQRSKTLMLVLGFTLLFFVLWFPYTVVMFLHSLQELHIISECVTSLHLDLAIVGTECIAFMHVYVNPVAYVLLNRRIWRKMRGRCMARTENLLGASESAGSGSSQESAVELKALHMYPAESEGSNAERQGHFLPYLT
ncbi:C-C chemokine receptor type 1 [Astyanax mexicanus]|uniref:C-C chemokine receptor type 1 n=1 Tax=Astyanax mexicanus TaxID=7994 RepID=UPI0020CB12BD|nr:C-C chemokine receptor type 1 [Astyanax mexicanus]